MASLKVTHWRLLLAVLLFAVAHCDPICEDPPCPAHAHCVEWNSCECDEGYMRDLFPDDGLPFCKPNCPTLPPHGHCVGLDEWVCDEGYELVDSMCHCVAPQKCECDFGYHLWNGTCVHDCQPGFEWDAEIEVCVEQKPTFVPLVTTPDTLSTTTEALPSSTELIDVEKVEVPMVHGEPPHDCQSGYVYVDGDCRPMLVDRCDLELCGPNSYCYDAMNCACLPGFKWLHAVSSAQGNCVDWHSLKSTARISTPIEEPSRGFWLIGFFASIGIVCVAIAFLVLVIVLYKTASK